MKLILLPLLLGMLAAPVWSQPNIKNVTFETSPGGADVFDFEGRIGASGQPIPLDLNKYKDNSDLVVVFRHRYCKDRRESIPLVNLGNRWPKEGTISLDYDLPWPWIFGATAVLGGVGLAIRWKRRPVEAQVQPDLSDSLVTATLGDYRILSRLGSGGMATVYKAAPAKDVKGEAVAVKVLSNRLDDQEQLDRFRREAKLTSRLSHPNILRMFDWGEERGRAFLVLELITGGTLKERLTGQPVAAPEVWNALAPVCAGLIYAHGVGIVHRDIKPENLMITDKGLLKITDFGLAIAQDVERLTASGTALGTPAYMAPEQISGMPPSPSMDQYAVGVLAFELLTGQVPFAGNDLMQIIFQKMSHQAPAPSSLAEVNPAVDAVVGRMLAKNPGDRYPSLKDAAAELERVLLV